MTSKSLRSLSLFYVLLNVFTFPPLTISFLKSVPCDHCVGSLFSHKEVHVHYIVRVLFATKIVNMITLYLAGPCTHHRFYNACYHSVHFLSKAYMIKILFILSLD
jgi:hypothetical protein